MDSMKAQTALPLFSMSLIAVFSAAQTNKAAANPGRLGAYAVQETLLGAIRSDEEHLSFSPDGRHVVLAMNRGQKQYLALDGQPEPEYDEVLSVDIDVNDLHPAFSPDSKHVGYIARAGDKWFAVLDSKASPGYDEVGRDFFLSPDAKHLAYLSRTGDKWSVVLDDKACGTFDKPPNLWDELRSQCGADLHPQTAAVSERRERVKEAATQARAQFDEIEFDGPVLSADGKHLAYAARKGEAWFVVADGQQSGAYDDARDVAFSADGKHLAYAAKRSGKWFAVIDGREGEEFDEVKISTTDFGLFMFSPDGDRAAYSARKGGKWFMVADGQAGPPFDWIRGPFFSSDSSHLLYFTRTAGKNSAVIDGHSAGEFDEIDDRDGHIFSPDGKRTAYRARRGDKQLVVVDGQPGPEFYIVDAPVFSPDSHRLAYQASRSPKRPETYSDVATQNQNWYAKYVDIPLPILGESILGTPSGRGYYNLKKAGRQLVVVDGKPSLEYDGVAGLTFSPDSKHVAYAALRAWKQFVVVDGQSSAAYDDIGEQSPVFDADGVLEFLAIRNNLLYRIRFTPKP